MKPYDKLLEEIFGAFLEMMGCVIDEKIIKNVVQYSSVTIEMDDSEYSEDPSNTYYGNVKYISTHLKYFNAVIAVYTNTGGEFCMGTWEFTTKGREVLFPMIVRAMGIVNSTHIPKTLKVWCGDEEEYDGTYGLHPIKQVEKAKFDIKRLLDDPQYEKNVYTNSTDYLCMIKAYAELKGVVVEYSLNMRESDFDGIMKNLGGGMAEVEKIETEIKEKNFAKKRCNIFDRLKEVYDMDNRVYVSHLHFIAYLTNHDFTKGNFKWSYLKNIINGLSGDQTLDLYCRIFIGTLDVILLGAVENADVTKKDWFYDILENAVVPKIHKESLLEQCKSWCTHSNGEEGLRERMYEWIKDIDWTKTQIL